MRIGAFVDLTSDTLTSDPASAQVNSMVGPGRELVDQAYGLYYERAYSRWLPVRRNAVSPDGTHYAYTDRPVMTQQSPPARATTHVVAVQTGAELAFDGGTGRPLTWCWIMQPRASI